MFLDHQPARRYSLMSPATAACRSIREFATFSVARRTTSSTSSSPSGARSGDQGRVHFLVTMRWRQRSSVPGVTIRCSHRPFGSNRDNAASTARSVHSSRGVGFARRKTATSRRSTSISAFFAACELANSASHDMTATANR